MNVATSLSEASGSTARHCRKTNRTARLVAEDSYWRLVASGEPFRLLFPLGTLIGLYGVLHWPFYIWHFSPSYPGTIHARIMIEGFLTAFVIGFLGTALPRLLDVPRFQFCETIGFAAGLICITLLHATEQTFWGDQLFLFMLGALSMLLGTRAFLFRKDNPPPGFVLVLLGLCSAIFGVSVQIVAGASAAALPEWTITLSRLLLYQGYLIFPIMGIGAFLLPRFFGLSNRQSFPESLTLPPGWKASAAFAIFCGVTVLVGFVLEALRFEHLGNAFRALGIVIYFVREVPFHKAMRGGGSLALGLRVALLSLEMAYVLMAIWPERRFTLVHLLFISGFALLTFIIATRVILGHSGQSAKFYFTLWPVLIMVVLVLLAMATRVSADWMPAVQLSHYAYASISFTVGVLIWGIFVLPSVRLKDDE